jgi:UDPglucose--hexose-1-phosphate uridylyltransferase
MSELRYHPFLDTWVITATHRQDRTFLPPADFNPLAPTKPGGFPTEIPFESYDVVVFENKFPSLKTPPASPAVDALPFMPVRPSDGHCEVVCYSQNSEGTFATMPYRQIQKLTRVWQERYNDLASRPEVEYVFIFENKGKEIGVTLTHPHGQIYAYSFIPPTMATELVGEQKYLQTTGNLLMGDVIASCKHLYVHENEHFVALIPPFARYPYEVYVAPKAHRSHIGECSPAELDDMAECLLAVTRKYDGLFGFSMPYIMSMHQSPTVPGYEFNWLHFEFYPPYRTAQKLKYLAGSEAGAGAFINDTLPEETSKTLRDIQIEMVR